MRAVIVRRPGGPEVLEVADRPEPHAGPGQVRIRVAAAAVNRIDLSTRSGALTSAGLLPAADVTGLGWDVAGVIDEVGAGVRRRAPGDTVIGLRDVLSDGGTQAEWVVLDETATAPAPRSVPLAAAATLPLIGLTADRSLALTGLRAGQTLLVTGAAGGVGGLVLQLAALRGIRTVAVAAKTDEPQVRDHGANDFINRPDELDPVDSSSDERGAADRAGAAGPAIGRSRGAERLGAAVRAVVPGGVDAVIDAAVAGITAHEALRAGGVFVALVAPFAPPPLRATRVVVQEVWADGGRLTELTALVDAGLLTLRVADTLPLDAVAQAHERLARGGLRGRLVLVP